MKTVKAVTAGTGLLIIVLLFTGCIKEYSYEGGTAVFSLLNVNGSCTDPVLSGNYFLGATLGPSNTVQLQVDVTNPGKFSFQTNSQSGFIFSATGSFPDTGVQTVTLTASGRPDSLGNFLFTPVLPSSCAFNVEVTMQQTGIADYTLTGSPNACSNVQVMGTYQKGIILTGFNNVVVDVDVTNPGDYVIHTDTLDGISFSATGHFTQAGAQQVTLLGSGTPITPQNLQFHIKGSSSTCSFTLVVESTGNPATYVIESGGGFCIGNLTGAYTAGVPLDVSNTYTLSVYVTVLGDFTISTATVNGMSFYYTGTFTTLGSQLVTLAGSGMPPIIGNFTLTPEIVGPHPIGGEACDFSVAVK